VKEFFEELREAQNKSIDLEKKIEEILTPSLFSAISFFLVGLSVIFTT